jgi:hypothetical protein
MKMQGGRMMKYHIKNPETNEVYCGVHKRRSTYGFRSDFFIDRHPRITSKATKKTCAELGYCTICAKAHVAYLKSKETKAVEHFKIPETIEIYGLEWKMYGHYTNKNTMERFRKPLKEKYYVRTRKYNNIYVVYIVQKNKVKK